MKEVYDFLKKCGTYYLAMTDESYLPKPLKDRLKELISTRIKLLSCL